MAGGQLRPHDFKFFAGGREPASNSGQAVNDRPFPPAPRAQALTAVSCTKGARLLVLGGPCLLSEAYQGPQRLPLAGQQALQPPVPRQTQQGVLAQCAGALAWEPGELEAQIKAGGWITAAASRPLLLKQVRDGRSGGRDGRVRAGAH